MNKRVTIEAVEDGFTIRSLEAVDEYRHTEFTTVVEYWPETELGTVQAEQRLMYVVLDALGINQNDHDRYRLRVIIVDQDGKEVE